MSDNVVDYLREQSARLNARLDDMSQWQAETSRRLVAIERHIAGVRRDIVLDAEDAANARERMDALAERVTRIERRLELAPDPDSAPPVSRCAMINTAETGRVAGLGRKHGAPRHNSAADLRHQRPATRELHRLHMHAAGPGDRLDAVVRAEHSIDPGEMHLHRADGQAEPARDRLGGTALGQQVKHLDLPLGEMDPRGSPPDRARGRRTAARRPAPRGRTRRPTMVSIARMNWSKGADFSM